MKKVSAYLFIHRFTGYTENVFFLKKTMSQYKCQGTCGHIANEMTVCETDGCTHQWEMMQPYDAESASQIEAVKDSNGNILEDGDSVTLIKDLTLRGSSQVIKRGTKVSKIRLTDNPEEVDCKIDGQAIVLRVEFLKKN